jgi:hypothetical protein
MLSIDCMTPIGFVWWNNVSNRWEYTENVGDTYIYCYNENPGNYPISDTTYNWIGVHSSITINSSIFGECPIPKPDLCFSFCFKKLFSECYIWQFTVNGTQNGKTKWSYISGVSTYNIVWNPTTTPQRWEMVYSANEIFYTTTTSDIPTNDWIYSGPYACYNLNANEGLCPTTTPLTSKVTATNTPCQGGCDGSIVVVANGGNPPYTYSIDGMNFQSSNIFMDLCEGTGNVIIQDSMNVKVTESYEISYDNVPSGYQIDFNFIDYNVILSSGTNFITEKNTWEVTITPPLPVGVTLSMDMVLSITNIVDEPGSGTCQLINEIYYNDTLLTPIQVSSPNIQSILKPNCVPYNQLITGYTETYNLVAGNGGTISGQTISTVTIQRDISGNGCSTSVIQKENLNFQNLTLNGCACCSVRVGKVKGGSSQVVYNNIY